MRRDLHRRAVFGHEPTLVGFSPWLRSRWKQASANAPEMARTVVLSQRSAAEVNGTHGCEDGGSEGDSCDAIASGMTRPFPVCTEGCVLAFRLLRLT